jgi:hypothetical protein
VYKEEVNMTSSSAAFRQHLLLSCATLAFSVSTAVPAYAANVTTAMRKDFARLTVSGAEGAKMTSSASGKRVIIQFDKPVPVTIGGIARELQPYIVGAEQSADKRQVVLTMGDDYPIRSFVSGDSSGVDVLFKGRPRPEQVVTEKTLLKPPAKVRKTASSPLKKV